MSRFPGKRRTRGFTLIELAVVMSIVAMLAVLGAPQIGVWAASVRIRTLAESLRAGLQFAQSEAVARNARVRFQLMTTTDNRCRPSTSGTSWVVHLDPQGNPAAVAGACASHTGPTDALRVLQRRAPEEGSAVVVAATDSGVAFNGLGRPVQAVPAVLSIDVSHPRAGRCAADGGNVTCLRVVVSPQGQVRLCNPRVAATDPQGC